MLFWTILKVCIKSLLANKLRSFLAMLGIIIGVGAVIAMLAMGAGAKKTILDRISSMGTNLLVVRPSQSGYGGVKTGSFQTMKIEDANALLAAEHVKAVAPVVSRGFQVKYYNKNTQTSIIGTSATYLGIRDFAIDRGRCFTEAENDEMERVAVMGPQTVEDLFGTADPIGQVIKIKGVNFTVIGVLKAKGDQGWYNADDQILVPYLTAMKRLMGLNRLGEVDVQATDGADLIMVEQEVNHILRRQHRIDPLREDPDFQIRNQADILETADEVGKTFSILLGSVGGISLLVGGIGIMNIMLVTVTERTREIGVRKAIGAKEKNILLQFLVESLIISGLGGIIGALMGITGAKIIASFSSFATVLQLPSILLAVSFSGLVGVFFGWYPARRAAKLDPVEALRYE
jgi:putative ABC transport system permease protein